MHVSVRDYGHDHWHDDGIYDRHVGLDWDAPVMEFLVPLLLAYAGVGCCLRGAMRDRDPEMRLSVVGTCSVIVLWPVCVARGVLRDE